jgi:hypothetical protein
MVTYRKPNLKETSIEHIIIANQMTISDSINPQTGKGKSRQEFSLSISATDGKMRLAKIIKSQLANGKQIRPNQIFGLHKHPNNMSGSSNSRTDSSKKRKGSRSRYAFRIVFSCNSLAKHNHMWANQHAKRGCLAHPSRCKTYLWVKTPHVTRGCFAHPSGCKSINTRGCYAYPYGCKLNTQQPVQSPKSIPYNPIFFGPLAYP